METEKIKFLVDFANRVDLDSENMRPGDLLNLRDDFGKLFFPVVPTTEPGGLVTKPLTQGSVYFDPRQDKSWLEYPIEKFEALQQEVKALLYFFTHSRGKKDVGGSAIGGIPVKVSYTLIGLGTGPEMSVMQGEVRDLFIFQVLQLLFDRERSSLIRRCPQCEKFFLRTRRQLYCSKKCVDAANRAAWLKTPKGKRYLKRLKSKSKKRRGRNERTKI